MINISKNDPCGSQPSEENNPPSNEPDAAQGSQFSQPSLVSDGSQYDFYVEEAREVVLAPSGQEVVSDASDLDADVADPQNEELSSSPYPDSSEEYESDESLVPAELLFVSQYAEEIHRHLRQIEIRFRPRDYMWKHPEITSGMRRVLVDWLTEVVWAYGLPTETLHLAVNYVDRFLSRTIFLPGQKLQLIGATALMIASKFEGFDPPPLTEFLYMTDYTYSQRQFIHIENFILRVLAFMITGPTSTQFLYLYMIIHPVCARTEYLAQYIAELSLMEFRPFLRYHPSMVAAGAYCLASYTVNNSFWPDSLYTFTGYTMPEIEQCCTDLHELYLNARYLTQQTIREKYNSSGYCRVSMITPPASLPFA